MLDLTGKSIAHEEHDGRCDLGDSDRFHQQSEVIEEGSAEEMEEPRPPDSRPGRVKRTPSCFPDTVMVARQDPVT